MGFDFFNPPAPAAPTKRAWAKSPPDSYAPPFSGPPPETGQAPITLNDDEKAVWKKKKQEEQEAGLSAARQAHEQE